ncbi:unnamed protein product, partial [Callosobruchus maculatus]
MVVNKFTNMQTQPNFNSMRRMFVPRKVFICQNRKTSPNY